LAPRVIYVAVLREKVVGFIAGHLTRRWGCDGELEWINVDSGYRGTGISSALFRLLVDWFVVQKALYVCVNCAGDNMIAQRFYRRHGAEVLNEHWLVWKDIGEAIL
jgi:GNAT superfamily N-acetyltransferase